MQWSDIKHFNPAEFDQRTPDGAGTGLAHMDIGFVAKLDKTRELLGAPMTVNSGWRSKEHDAAVAKAAGKPVIPDPNSHVDGHAADMACTGARERFYLIKAALEAGINRIGFDEAHVHLDDDPRCAPNVIWKE